MPGARTIVHIVCEALSCIHGVQPKILRTVLGFVGRVPYIRCLRTAPLDLIIDPEPQTWFWRWNLRSPGRRSARCAAKPSAAVTSLDNKVRFPHRRDAGHNAWEILEVPSRVFAAF